MVTSIIIGMGEVGRALNQVLSTCYNTVCYDAKWDTMPDVDDEDGGMRVLHICIPFGDGFDNTVQSYQKAYQPSYTIIHSTTPVGTCKALDVYHSPVRGIHPHLAESLTTFITYLAPKNNDLLFYLQKAGMTVHPVNDTDTTEAGKLWSLTAYALNIILEKEIHNWCTANNVDFNTVYKHFTHTYNNGYNALGMDNYNRPILEHMEGEIGGHCIMPAVEKLASGSKLARSIVCFNNGNS